MAEILDLHITHPGDREAALNWRDTLLAVLAAHGIRWVLADAGLTVYLTVDGPLVPPSPVWHHPAEGPAHLAADCEMLACPPDETPAGALLFLAEELAAAAHTATSIYRHGLRKAGEMARVHAGVIERGTPPVHYRHPPVCGQPVGEGETWTGDYTRVTCGGCQPAATAAAERRIPPAGGLDGVIERWASPAQTGDDQQ